MSSEQEIQETLQQLKNTDEKIRSQAALSLGWIGESSVIESLVEVLGSDPSAKVRANAAMSLGQLNDKTAITPLIDALEDEDAFVRGMVIYSLALMKAIEAKPYLIKVLEKDPDKEARMAAADSLAQIGDKSTIFHLIRAYMNDKEQGVRAEAKDSLRRLGSALNYSVDELIDKAKSGETNNKPLPEPPSFELRMDNKDELTDDVSIDKEIQDIEAVIEEIDELEDITIDEVNETEVEVEDYTVRILEPDEKTIKSYLLEELPKILEYAIHKEVIALEKICNRFSCTERVFIDAINELISKKIIEAEINAQNKTITVLKPHSILSDDAQIKLKLIRKKFGIDW